jgi:hypothetical protein
MKAQTKTVEIQGIEIAIPVGSMDKPSAESERIMKVSQNPANWKLPLSPYHTYDKSLADDLCYCYNWYFGGHEIEAVQYDKFGTLYRVSSKGYYHYVGA